MAESVKPCPDCPILAEATAYWGYYDARKALESDLARLGKAHARRDSRDVISLIDRTVAARMRQVERAEDRIKEVLAEATEGGIT